MTTAPNPGRLGRDLQALLEQVREASVFVNALHEEIAKVIVGQRRMVDRILIGLLTDGHILLEGVPGLAKTLTVRTTAQALAASFSRIQFTPDLLPADVVGTLIFDPRDQTFVPRQGPVFANLVLADEINRAPAKVQSALLEAMQEHQVTIGDTTYPLPEPFLVLATQNPIEQEGTYPLPEAQQDRFMLHVRVPYPTRDEERRLLEPTTAAEDVRPVVDLEALARIRRLVKEIHVDDKIRSYIVDLVWATREPEEAQLRELDGLIELGASPRATLALDACARAYAFLRGRPAVFPEDVKAIGADVLRHRVKLSYEAEAENVRVEDVIRKVFDAVPIP